MDIERSTSAAQTRAFAVAKLRRAASLPRMAGGRRPPMHADGISEGERTPAVQTLSSESDLSLRNSLADVNQALEQSPMAQPTALVQSTVDTNGNEPLESSTKHELDGEKDSDAIPSTTTHSDPISTARTKRRTRSRSQSRASRDFKNRARQNQTPTHNLQHENESSQDDDLVGSLSTISQVPKLISPRPSYHEKIQPSNLFMSNTLIYPDGPFMYPVSSPGTPMPTLEALQNGLQKGLFRSNSAAARMMAMHKLTGGADTYDETFPLPVPPSSFLSRSNTVSGGERSTARKHMLRRLGERVREGQSGTESPQPEELNTGKRRRRRSRRSSTPVIPGTSVTVLEDLERSSGVANMPVIAPPSPALFTPTDNLFATEPLARILQPSPLIAVNSPSLTPAKEHGSGASSPRPTPSLKHSIGSNGSNDVVPRKRRSVFVEPEDNDPPAEELLSISTGPTPINSISLPETSPRFPTFVEPNADQQVRSTRSSKAPSPSPNNTRGSPLGMQVFSAASNATHLKMASNIAPYATPGGSVPTFREEEDDERVVYNQEDKLARSRPLSPTHEQNDRILSWVAEPVAHNRAQVQDDGKDIDKPQANQAELQVASRQMSKQSLERSLLPLPSLQVDVDGNDTDIDEKEPWREHVDETVTTFETPNEDATTSFRISGPSLTSDSNEAAIPRSSLGSHQMRAKTPSYPSRAPSDKSIAKSYNSNDERRLARQPSPSKRAFASALEKVKNTFSRSNSIANSLSRSNSATGRHSRTMSSSRRDHTESSASRESDTPSFKSESGAEFSLSLPGSPSVMDFFPQPASPATSHFPPPAPADMLKYSNSKLFPFPGMKHLEEQRRVRGQGLPDSPSTPEAPFAPSNSTSNQVISSKSTVGIEPHISRSETRPDEKFVVSLPSEIIPTNLDLTSSGQDQGERHLSVDPQTSHDGVRRWMSTKKNFPLSPSSPNFHPVGSTKDAEALPERRAPSPAISNLATFTRASETPASSEPVLGQAEEKDQPPKTSESASMLKKASDDAIFYFFQHSQTKNEQIGQSSAVRQVTAPRSLDPSRSFLIHEKTGPPEFSPLEETRTSPDPSQSDYHTRSNSNTTFSTDVLRRLDEILGSGTRSPTWARVLEDPPRKLILSSPVVQVVNANTVKDRFLFLFTDIFVIASPTALNPASPLDSAKPDPSERRMTIRNVVQLRDLRHSSEREGGHRRTISQSPTFRHPLIRAFVLQFIRDQNYALSTLFQKSGQRESSLMTGQLLASIPDIDRKQLGEYFCRRSSRSALHAYLDCFGFAGVRIDAAMRVFLHSVVIPDATSAINNPANTLLDAFAVRWYDANKAIVAYDTQLAFRLVRAMVQLNEVMHGGISREPGSTGYPRSRLARKDFIDAFRIHDTRGLATDELLSNLYDSIRNERLSQARHTPSNEFDDIPVTIKRGLPKRLTLCEKSEPAVIRIPQSDPYFAISLHGLGLIFEPPVLTFAKSPEASFRVTSSSLGATHLIMCREGPNATLYAGLPPTSPVMVERAFMRNTFNVAFLNHEGVKRRYMFSVEDALLRHQWNVSLDRQINLAVSAAPSSGYYAPSIFQTAADRLAFKVLQETLITKQEREKSSPLPIAQAMDRLTSSTLHSPSKSSSSKTSKEQRRGMAVGGYNSPHDLNLSGEPNSALDQQRRENDFDAESIPRLWSVRELQILCQQNSSIGAVLSYLQVVPPDA